MTDSPVRRHDGATHMKRRSTAVWSAVSWAGPGASARPARLARQPRDLVAIGLPDWSRLRRLIDDTEATLKKLGVTVLVVHEDGAVEVRLRGPAL